MRELKFRAWFPKNHWYHKGMLFDWQDTTGVESLCFVPSEKTGIHVMQFADRQDKHGQDLYEGDVVRWTDTNIRMVISWSTEDGAWIAMNVNESGSGAMATVAYMDHFELIGNIHENPELLNEKATE